MDKQGFQVEEIISLTGEHADYYFSLAMSGDIRVKGKFITDENGRLRPVLVKTTFLPPDGKNALESSNQSWGVAITEATTVQTSTSRKKDNWLRNFFNWAQQFIK